VASVDLAAFGVALASATGFAVSTSLQHHAAGTAPESATGVLAFVRHLLSKRTWLAGQLLALVSFGLHALALRLGPMAQVQPIVISGVVLAVPARAMMSRQRPGRRELVAVIVTTFGLGLFLVASDPSEGTVHGDGDTALVVTLVGLALAAVMMWLGTRLENARAHAALLGATAGLLFGVVAGLIKLVIEQAVDEGVVAVLTGWPLWLLLVAGASGIVTNQRAYRMAALSASLPVLNIVDVLVATFVGLVVFEEVPAHSPTAIVLVALAVGCAAAGLRNLARVEEQVAIGGAADLDAGLDSGADPDLDAGLDSDAAPDPDRPSSDPR
jgi:drug/metabolite transporter (DMT)-like permease